MRTVGLLAAALALVGAAPAHASGGSLAYAKGGDVYLSSPAGSDAVRLTSDGGYAWPSQADDGTLIAVRQTAENGRTPRRLHRIARDGSRLGTPIETVPVGNANFIGPLAPQVSPDGSMVAYHYFNTGVLSERTRTSVAYTRVDAGTQPGVFGGALGGYLTPSWTADGRVLVFYGAERTSHVGIDTPGAGYVDWFGDPAVQTLLTDGELTRAGDRLVAVGDQNDLRFYDAGAAPALRCVMTGFNGNVSDPTWSPEGDALAWEEGDGIHVAHLPDLAGCAAASRPLVVPGGNDPDWGPAAPSAAMPGPVVPTDAGTPPTGRFALRLSGLAGSLPARTAARRGVRLTVTCSQRCSLKATVAIDAKTSRRLGLGRKARTIATVDRAAVASTTALTLRLTPAAARRLTRVGQAEATLRVTAGTAGGERATATRRLRFSR